MAQEIFSQRVLKTLPILRFYALNCTYFLLNAPRQCTHKEEMWRKPEEKFEKYENIKKATLNVRVRPTTLQHAP